MTNNEKALQMHKEWNGKLETTAKAHVNSREDLAIAGSLTVEYQKNTLQAL